MSGRFLPETPETVGLGGRHVSRRTEKTVISDPSQCAEIDELWIYRSDLRERDIFARFGDSF